MKKIYMVSCLLATVLLFANAAIFAQSDLSSCFGSPSTSPNARILHLKGFNSPGPLTNTLSFVGMPVGSTIRIYANTNIAGAPTLVEHTFVAGDNGAFNWSYPANTVNPPVVNCVSGTGAGCCLKSIPTLLDCSVGQAINFAPFIQSGECRMLVKVNNGDIVQLLNTAGQVVPNVFEYQTRIDIGGGQEFACISYPCGTLLGTITACGLVNCCSRPFVASGTLPIVLSDFKASLSQGKTILNWSSSVEVDSKNYEIEKSSNGRDFNTVGSIASAGNSYSVQKYSYIDQNTSSGAAFYRLKMVDLDGKYEYSKVVYINAGRGGTTLTVGPNPFTDYIQLIGITSAEVSRANVQVINQTGQQVAYKITGANTIILDNAAPKGLYILKIKGQQFKIVKQ